MTAKLQAQLEAVEADISAARATVEKHRATWRHQCSNALYGAAEATEEAITSSDRHVLRLVVRREHLQEQLKTAPQLTEA